MLADKLRAVSAGLPLPVFVSSSVNRVFATSNTVTAPTGIQNGDLLVAVGFSVNADPLTLPSGFSLGRNTLGATNNAFVATKTANSESGNYVFNFGTSNNSTIAILVYRNATTVNTVGVINEASTSSNIVTAPEIIPTYEGTLCACWGLFGGFYVSGPSGMTQRALQNADNPKTAVFDLSQAAVATGGKIFTADTNGRTSRCFLLQITNEPTVAPEFVASASTQNTVTGTTLVINKPTGTVEGDLMVAVMTTSGNSSGTWTPATGWTEVADVGGTDKPMFAVAYKQATASEASSYTFTSTQSNNTNAGAILTYRYAAYDTIGTFTTGTNPLILPSISPSESQSILIAAGARAAVSITLGTPISMTARVTDSDATQPSYIVCDQTVAKGPTGTRSMTTGSALNVVGILLSIKPTRNL